MSEIRATTISDAAGTGPIALTKQSAAKVWCAYDQTTPEIQDSFNISSFTDASTGIGQPNFTNNMTNALFVVGALGVKAGVYYMFGSLDTRNAGYTKVIAAPNSAPTTTQDPSDFCVSVQGDLA